MEYNWHNKSILIVEDDSTSNEFFYEVLTPTKAKLYFAFNGYDAINIFKNKKIDLVLLDIQLPSISGTVVLNELKKINSKIPIIAETAYALTGDREKYLKSGFDEYISKPILPNELLNLINKFFVL